MFRGNDRRWPDGIEVLLAAHRSDLLLELKEGNQSQCANTAREFVVDASLSINHSRLMDISRATTIMSALAQPTRLRTFRLLVEHGDVGIASGVIAAAVGAPQNTMSSHLTILTHAGLVKREQQGRVVRYTAVLEEVASLGTFLLP